MSAFFVRTACDIFRNIFIRLTLKRNHPGCVFFARAHAHDRAFTFFLITSNMRAWSNISAVLRYFLLILVLFIGKGSGDWGAKS